MKRWWIYAALFLIVVAILLIAPSLGTKHRVVLPDGTEVILRDVTYGTTHRYLVGNIFQRTAAAVLPDKFKARLRISELGVPQHLDMAGVQTLVAWIEYSGRQVSLRVCDDAGHEQLPYKPNASWQTLSSDRKVAGHVFSSFPRRSRFFTMRIYSREGMTEQFRGEFRVRNPAYGKHPAWTPEPLPIKRETNDLSFTLMRFETGVSGTNEFASMAPLWTEIEYEYGPPDFISGPWTPLDVVISDATGNRIRRYRPTQQYVVGIRPPSKSRTIDLRRRGVVSVPAMLWLDEAAWHIHLELERSGISGFRSNEIWEVNDVAVPRIGETNSVRQSIQRYGTNIVFESIAGYDAGNRPYVNPILKLEMGYLTRSDLRVFLQQVTDQRGRPVANSDFYLHPLSPESQRLNFRFVVHSVIALDFTAKPQFATNRVLNPENSLLIPRF
jgi:hypothetical protein